MRKCVLSRTKMRQVLFALQALIRKGADIEAKDETGLTPLYYAVLSEQVDMIRVRHSSSQFLTEENFWQVVIAEGAKIEAATTTGWTPLFYAVVTRNVEVVRVSHDDKRHLADTSIHRLSSSAAQTPRRSIRDRTPRCTTHRSSGPSRS